MSHEVDADYTRIYLLPPAVEQWVAADHPVRVVREVVDQCLAAGEWQPPKSTTTEGRPHYSPKLLLKVWVAAYMGGFRSCREVEQLCRDYMPFMWLCGGLRPDHNTLWRFWRKHQDVVARLFSSTVRTSFRLGLVEMAINAIDGTKIAAAGSTNAVTDSEQLAKKLTRVDDRIREIESEIERARAGESVLPLETLSAELRDREVLRERVREEIEIAKREGTRVHPGEPEARLMKKIGLGYNAQTVVDAKHSVIVAQAVVTNANDEAQLVPMLDRVHKEQGRVATENLGDAGYNTNTSLAAAEERQYSVLVSPSQNDPESNTDNPYHAAHFRYDEDTDQWICPQGAVMTLRSSYTDKRTKKKVKRYRTNHCKLCPVRDLCTREKRGRTIELREGYGATVRQRQKRSEPHNRELLKKRMAIVERPFAVIKSIFGFRRFRSRGLHNARAEWSFVCAVHNIKLLMRLFSTAPSAA